jgi:hypothetical protein
MGPVMGRGGHRELSHGLESWGVESQGLSHRLGPVMRMMSQWVQS